MSTVIFSLTDRQAFVLRTIAAGESVTWHYRDTLDHLVKRGLVAPYTDRDRLRLTTLGKHAASIAAALARPERH